MTATQHITRVIDRFYIGPLRRVVPLQTFRYLACGGLNMVVTTVAYVVAFHLVFGERNLDLGFIVVAAHTAPLAIAWPVSILVGFWLQKNISFRGSPLRRRTQLFRYFLSNLVAALATWLLQKLFVEIGGIFPTAAFCITYLTTAALGYVMQKYFTFRGAEK